MIREKLRLIFITAMFCVNCATTEHIQPKAQTNPVHEDTKIEVKTRNPREVYEKLHGGQCDNRLNPEPSVKAPGKVAGPHLNHGARVRAPLA